MTSTPRRRMRSSTVSLGVTAVVAAGLSGCASSPDYAAVCVNPDTDERVSDDECDDASTSGGSGIGSAFVWYYLGASSRVPSLGSRVSGGTLSSPSNGSVQRGGLPTTGGSSVKSTTKSGGFGGTSRGISG